MTKELYLNFCLVSINLNLNSLQCLGLENTPKWSRACESVSVDVLGQTARQATRAEKERGQRQEVPSEREERLGRQSLSTATAGSQAFTLREKGILLRRALLRTEVVYSLLF